MSAAETLRRARILAAECENDPERLLIYRAEAVERGDRAEKVACETAYRELKTTQGWANRE